MKPSVILLLGAALMTLSACATQRHYVNSYTLSGTRAVKEDQDFFVYGIGQTQEVNAASICGGQHRVAATESKQTPVNVVLGVVTFGIYTPRQQTTYCM